MAKDRNTMAKRQREVDKRRKAEEKRDKRNRRISGIKGDESPEPDGPQLSEAELGVLSTFRKYLMRPGQMLCLSNTDIGSMKATLEGLVESGLLVPEDFKGGYSLTEQGYELMSQLK